MRKSTIWILAAIMAVAFFGLLYVQIEYVSKSKKMRSDHFDEAIKRSLYQVANDLEVRQTKQYLFEEIERQNRKTSDRSGGFIYRQQFQQREVAPDQYQFSSSVEYYEGVDVANSQSDISLFQSPNKSGGNAIVRASSNIQQEIIRRYIRERDILDEVVSKLLETPSKKPIDERINFKELENDLENEIKRNNGILVPYFYEIVDKNNKPIRRQAKFQEAGQDAVYSQILFPNDPADRHTYLRVHFPSKNAYIYQEVSFLVPAVMFTFILLVTFIIIISMIFRQKRLSEMKSDFMNNMTHELKTPVSTISLAAQMLKDGSIMKSPDVFKHISGVINDETERLSFQVEKVLQMSLFEKQKATLKFKELEMNEIIVHVASTFQIKVEKFGGSIDIDLEATENLISGDKMHITNVLFNLLDNAVKYRREDTPLELMIRTRNNSAHKLCISVEDNGMGMRREDAKKVFDRFYRVSTGNRHDVKGFGLGLAYVKKIVEDHGGTIKADSELGIGTKFIITLPLVKSIIKYNKVKN